jgi:uncharacterized repeat protein (TIGR01451 family)
MDNRHNIKAARQYGGSPVKGWANTALRPDAAKLNISQTAGHSTESSARLPKSAISGRFRQMMLALLLIVIVPLTAFGATEPGTVLSNTAKIEFKIGTNTFTAYSNTSSHTAVEVPTGAVITLYNHDPADAASVTTNVPITEFSATTIAGPFSNIPAAPVDENAATIDLTATELVPTTGYDTDEAVFFSVADSDQNLDFSTIETVVMIINSTDGDKEILRLTETGVNTGIFTGYIQTTTAAVSTKDSTLSVSHGSTLTTYYTDPTDAADTTTASASVTVPSNSTISALKYAPLDAAAVIISVPTAEFSTGTTAGPYGNVTNPVDLAAGAIDLSTADLVNAPRYQPGEAVFLSVNDNDQNVNTLAVDTLVMIVNSSDGDTEILRFTETGPNTGIFTGYIQTTTNAVATKDGELSVANGSTIDAYYTDKFNSADVSTISIPVATPSVATIDIMHHDPTDAAAVITTVPTAEFSTGTTAGPYGNVAAPLDTGGTPINLAAASIANSPVYDTGEAVFFKVTDTDQNANSLLAETIVMIVNSSSGDTEILRLTETGPNTGIFTGYIQTTTAAVGTTNGALTVPAGGTFTAYYTDPLDASDVSTAAAATVSPSASALSAFKYAPLDAAAVTTNVPTAEFSTGTTAGPYGNVANPVDLAAGAINLTTAALVNAPRYQPGEAVFLSIADNDQNIDPLTADTAVLLVNSSEGDIEILRLTETGPNTGLFTGYIQTTINAVSTKDGVLSVADGSTVDAYYTDKYNAADVSTLSVPTITPSTSTLDVQKYDPADAAAIITTVPIAAFSTGTTTGPFTISPNPVDINTMTNINLAAAALVNSTSFVSDESVFLQVKDSDQNSDTTVVDTLVVTITTSAGDTEIIRLTETGANTGIFVGYVQSSGNAPTNLNGSLDVGNTGSTVTISYTDALDTTDTKQVVLNIAPVITPLLYNMYVTKQAGKNEVSVGEFLPYIIQVTEGGGNAISNVTVTDTLPLGFRYRSGSANVNGVSASDPAISNNGRDLTFSVGTLPAAGTITIKFVTEIGAGAKSGVAVNLATANGTGVLSSNTANAKVVVVDQLQRDKNIIVGQVLYGVCEMDDIELPDGPQGVAGVRIYLEDGSYVLTDARGMYHFEGLDNGTHVVQLDLATISEHYVVVSCEENTAHAGTPHSQFVDLHGGALWRTDFHLRLKPRAEGHLNIELLSELRPGELVKYEIPIEVGKVPLSNLRLSVMLPAEATYVPGSSTFNDEDVEDPFAIMSALNYRLPNLPANGTGTLGFTMHVPTIGDAGELVTRASLGFDTPTKKKQRTPLLENKLTRDLDKEELVDNTYVLKSNFSSLSTELSERDMKELDKLAEQISGLDINHLFATGHTDSVQITGEGLNLFKNNYSLSRARARAVVRYLGDILGLKPYQVSFVGVGDEEPVASNNTPKGQALNRRVEVKVYTNEYNYSYSLKSKKDRSGVKRMSTVGQRPGENKRAIELADKPIKFVNAMPEFDRSWIEAAKPGIQWLWPEHNVQPHTAAMHIAIKHDPLEKVTLNINGHPVDPLSYNGKHVNKSKTVGITKWRAVRLQRGDNVFDVSFVKDGKEKIMQRTIHYPGSPVDAKLVKKASYLIANGKDTPVVAVRLLDKDEYPARKGVVGWYHVKAPYRPGKLRSGNIEGRASFVINDDGIAYLKLEPTTRTGRVTVQVKTADGIKEITAWLMPESRDWVLVGLAEGSLGDRTVSGNMENLTQADETEDYYNNGRLAFFAKGKVKGQWLLTMAYDSDKDAYNEYELHKMIDPGRYYTLYGDATQQGSEAASARKLYVKIERGQFYALFGDYNTELTMTELGRYSRALSGLKAAYEGDRGSFNVFAADTSHAFTKDELSGDGTSGLYQLSKTNIAMNSERIRLITRDRFRSEIVLQDISLSRHIDYTIDYVDGTIFFKEPVLSKDGDLNPIYIVVEYESYDSSNSTTNYGGRGALKLMEDKVEVGGTYIRDAYVGKESNLTAIDVTVKPTKDYEIKAEVAGSKTTTNNTSGSGSAYTVQASKTRGRLQGTAYHRKLETGFGIGHNKGGQSGTQKTGFDTSYKYNNSVRLTGLAYKEESLALGNERTHFKAASRYSMGNYQVRSSLSKTVDDYADGTSDESTLLGVGASIKTLSGKVTLKVDREQPLGSAGSSDFPTRTTLGADIMVRDNVTLKIAHEFAEGDQHKSRSARYALEVIPWEGGLVATGFDQARNEDGTREISTVGLKQTWKVNEQTSVSSTLDQSKVIKDTRNIEGATDDSDFWATSLGVNHHRENFSWRARAEYHDSSVKKRIGMAAGISGEPKEGTGLSVGVLGFKTETPTSDTFNADVRLGVVYRPFNHRWTVLNRTDFIFETLDSTELSYDNWRLVNIINANYKVMGKGQLSMKYGMKYLRDRIDNISYTGFTDLIGLEGRYDIKPKWDVGAVLNVLRTPSSGMTDSRTGVFVGYTYFKDVWVSVGYNMHGFTDKDFSKSDYTAKGMYVKFRMKFDQRSAHDAVKWLTKN